MHMQIGWMTTMSEFNENLPLLSAQKVFRDCGHQGPLKKSHSPEKLLWEGLENYRFMCYQCAFSAGGQYYLGKFFSFKSALKSKAYNAARMSPTWRFFSTGGRCTASTWGKKEISRQWRLCFRPLLQIEKCQHLKHVNYQMSSQSVATYWPCQINWPEVKGLCCGVISDLRPVKWAPITRGDYRYPTWQASVLVSYWSSLMTTK